MVKHWLPEGYEFLFSLILPFVVGAEELWRAHKNARGAREEGEDARVFPPSHACGGIFSKPQMESVWQSGTNVFLNAVKFSETHYLLGVLDASFIVL